jgi:hypothetical protein
MGGVSVRIRRRGAALVEGGQGGQGGLSCAIGRREWMVAGFRSRKSSEGKDMTIRVHE